MYYTIERENLTETSTLEELQAMDEAADKVNALVNENCDPGGCYYAEVELSNGRIAWYDKRGPYETERGVTNAIFANSLPRYSEKLTDGVHKLGNVERWTEKAILFRPNGHEHATWIPKSQLALDSTHASGQVTILVTRWMHANQQVELDYRYRNA